MNILDKTYWGSGLIYPLCPSDENVKEYKLHMMRGTTLMLGCTKKLIPISNRQLDIDPWYDGETVIKGDWIDNKHFYSNIILDGGLCFTKELCDNIIDMASKNCKVFISRSFNRKLDTMKIANYFPQVTDFKILPTFWYNKVGSDYTFYVWEF